ncbi:MAG: ParB N-terminal domain-containing protein [Phycisphaerales bacterium]|nr:ParB N-terminal domain-containing protein [Phycisphaerales bacterium]
MQIDTIPTSLINPAPYNPRLDLKPGDPDYEKLRRSMDEFGLVEPLVWNSRTGHLVGGHQRFKVLLQQGVTAVDVSVVDLPIEREKALNIALNKISGDWDQAKLAALLDELTAIPDLDVTLTGFDLPDVHGLIAHHLLATDHQEQFDLDAALANAGPPVTKPGELILLGTDPRTQHRLLCDDCTDPLAVRRLMNGERAVLFATDPPYLVNYDGTNHPGKSKADAERKNKDWSGTYGERWGWDEYDANSDLYYKFIAVAVAEAIRPDAAWYCWHASRRQSMLEEAWTKHGAFVHEQIIWVKNRGILTRSWYSWQHEPCFFGWLQGHKPPKAEDAPILSSVWEIPTLANNEDRPDHPTPKPLEVFEIPMRQHTRGGEICFEPFAGSGTQIIAAQRLGRRCFATEVSPIYCDLIVRRFIAFAGEQAVSPEIADRYRLAPVSPPPDAGPPVTQLAPPTIEPKPLAPVETEANHG